MADDYAKNPSTTGSVAVGGTATGEIETGNDFDWFRVELVAGRTYVIDLEGSDSGGGTLDSTVLRGLYDSEGNRIAGTQTNDGGDGDDARLYFTATESGTHYIAARGYMNETGTYTVRVTEQTVSDDTRAGARDLGDITNLAGPRFPEASLDGDADEVDYFKFTLTAAKKVGLGLRQQDADADLFLEDANGTVLHSSTVSGTANEAIEATLLAGTYYVRVVAQEEGDNAFRLRYGVSAPDAEVMTALEQEGTENRPPAFAAAAYGFELVENADGSTTPVVLGTVAATDPDGDTPAYSIAAGNDDDLFEIDASTGALTYKGTGEDYESDATSYALTVRASDGTLHNDVAVTVSIADVNEAPAFAVASYAFELAENVDGSTTRVALGTVAATDPDEDTLAYSIAAGNDDDLFEVDATTGALSYKGTGEDHESGTTSYALTVRASDGTLHNDVAVTVSVTDVVEPAISVTDAEAEETDGVLRFQVTLSEATTVPVSVNYATADGTAIAGEDYTQASGTLVFAPGETEKTVEVTLTDDDVEDSDETLTLRLSDPAGGTLGDASATGTILNAEADTPSPPASVSEPAGGDLPADTTTTGVVAVGGSVTGVIGSGGDRDWFAVSLEAGRTYRIDLKGADSDAGTLSVPILRGLYDTAGNRIKGTTDYDGGVGRESRLVFTASAEGTHYIAADALGQRQGSYELAVTDLSTDGDGRADATDLGDITELERPESLGSSLGGTDSVDYFRFTLHAARKVELGLRRQDADADLFLEAADGTVIASSTETGAANEGISETLLAGTYYIRVEAQEEGDNDFLLRYGVDEPDAAAVAALQELKAPVFGAASYAFELAENADGSTTPVALGTVSATDPDDDALTYSIAAGNDAGLFEIDASTGELTYKGTGEDYESDTASYELTVRASDGTLERDVAVTVNVTDVAEAPVFAEASYAFDLAENADGSTTPVALGTVSATDPEDDGTVRYSIAAGNDAGLFEIDASTGALSYKGTGEDHESDTASYELTVRASDNSLHSDVTVTVTVTDVQEEEQEQEGNPVETPVAEAPKSVSEPAGQDLPANRSTSGRVTVGGEATGTVETGDDRDWFAIELEAGLTCIIDLQGREAGSGTLDDPYLFGVYNSQGELIAGTSDNNSGHGHGGQVTFTPTESGTYYISAGAYWFREYTGTYKLKVKEGPTDNTHDNARNLGDITNLVGPRSSNGAVGGVDELDYYAFTLNEARTVSLDLREQDANADLYLENAEGKVLYSSVEAGTADERISELLSAGTYYVRIAPQQTSVNQYVFRYGIVWEDEATADTSTTATVVVGGSVKGRIGETGDRDWFAVVLEEGKTYVFDLLGKLHYSTPLAGGSLGNPYLRGIYDANGDLIPGTTNDDASGHPYNSRVQFTPTESGTYYVEADVGQIYNAPMTGTYTLSVRQVVEDDYPSDTSTAGVVTVGGSVNGKIGTETETDWFAVTLEADKTYLVRLKGSGTDKLKYPFLHGIHDAEGNPLSTTGLTLRLHAHGHHWLYVTPELDGTYYISAGANDRVSHWDTRGTYTLSVVEVPEDDYASQSDTTGTVAVGGTATGSIEVPGDSDWFAVTLEAGQTYEIKTAGADGKPWRGDPFVHAVHGSNGETLDLVTTYAQRTDNTQVFVTPSNPGEYFIVIRDDWHGVGTGPYSVAVKQVEQDDRSEDIDTLGTATLGASVRGKIETPNDRDWFAVTLEAGKLYHFNVKGAYNGGGTLVPPCFYGIFDADGNPVIDNGDNIEGMVPEFDRYIGRRSGYSGYFTPDEDGTYFVSVGSWHVTPWRGTYTLLAEKIADSDLPPNTSTTGTVTVGGSVTGRLDYDGDKDWFSIALAADKTYRIEVKGDVDDDYGGTLHNPALVIFGSAGDRIDSTYDDNSGTGLNARLDFSPNSAGTYYIEVEDPGGVGTYTVEIVELDYEDNTDTAGVVTVGGSVSSRVDAMGDRDWFAVTLEADKLYHFNTKGQSVDSGYTLWYSYLHGIYNDVGELIVEADDIDGVDTGGYSVSSDGYSGYFAPSEGGTYYISVGSYFQATGAYTLSVEEIADRDSAADTGTTGAVTVGGSTTDKLDYPDDEDWLAVTLAAGKTYRIDVKGSARDDYGGTLNDPSLTVFDGDGNAIDSAEDDNGGVGNNAQLDFTPDMAGTHYIGIEGSGGLGSYTVEVDELLL